MHPMYRPPVGSDLCQGDLVQKKELVAALRGHQDYILQRSDFEAFCVMTQTCDLVRSRKEEFITMAVVRAITNIFDKSEARKKGTADRLRNIVQHRANTRFFYVHP